MEAAVWRRYRVRAISSCDEEAFIWKQPMSSAKALFAFYGSPYRKCQSTGCFSFGQVLQRKYIQLSGRYEQSLQVCVHAASGTRAPCGLRVKRTRFPVRCRKWQLNQVLSVLSHRFLLSVVFAFHQGHFHCVALLCVYMCFLWLFLLGCHYQCKWLTGKNRLRNDLWCVDGNVKPYSLTTVF